MLLDIYLTNTCNLRCRYCYLKEKNQKRSNIDLIQEILKYFLDLEPNDKILYCTFIGGEPTLEFELMINAVRLGKKLAKKAKKKIFFNLVTNGVRLNTERINFLKENNFYVVLSFDGKKSTQDYQRTFPDGKSSFHLVESNLDNLIKEIPNFSVRMTVTPAVVEKLFENVKYFFLKGVNLLGIVPDYENNWSSDDLYVFRKNFKDIIKMWNKNMKKHSKFYILPFVNYLKSWENKDFYFHPYMHFCQLGHGLRYSVSVNGDIYSCHRFTSIEKDEFKLGNVLKGGIKLELEKDFYKKVAEAKKEIKNPGCFALNYDINKNIKKPLSNYQRFKNMFLELFSEICQEPIHQKFLNKIKSFT